MLSRKKQDSGVVSKSGLSDLAFGLLLFYALFMILPVNYQVTMPVLDASWGYALNYFIHSQYRFGPDLIFTYGPLGFLNNPQHVGNDIAVALIVRGLFWLATGLQLVSIWRCGKRAAAVAFCLCLILSHKLYYDYWDYSLLALAIITFSKLLRAPARALDFCLIPGLIGVSFLLKFTAFSMILGMLCVYTIHICFRRKQKPSLASAAWLMTCFLSGPTAYLLYNPSLVDLAIYFKAALQIATGFATAMSLEPFYVNEVFAISMLLLLLGQLVVGLLSHQFLWAEGLLICPSLWIVFRHGFIRGGYGDHSALFFGLSILLFATLFMSWDSNSIDGGVVPYGRGHVVLVFSFAAFTFISMSGYAERYPLLVRPYWWAQESLAALAGLTHWEHTVQILDHGADKLFAAQPGMRFKHAIEGKRVLVFPFSTPYVAKIPFEMAPIYALQAYSAYTSLLDSKGAQNLKDARPQVEKVVLEWDAIDGRNPVLDTPSTYSVFLSHFSPEASTSGAVLLKRRASPLALNFAPISHVPFMADKWVNVPVSNHLVALSITLGQTLFGNLLTSLYCQKPVYLQGQTTSGKNVSFRIPPQVATNPMLANYLPNSLEEVERLWGTELSVQDRIQRIRLSGPGLLHAVSKGFFFFNVTGLNVTFAGPPGQDKQAGCLGCRTSINAPAELLDSAKSY